MGVLHLFNASGVEQLADFTFDEGAAGYFGLYHASGNTGIETLISNPPAGVYALHVLANSELSAQQEDAHFQITVA